MHNHLRECHKLSVDTADFQRYLRESVLVLDTCMEPELEKNDSEDITDFVVRSHTANQQKLGDMLNESHMETATVKHVYDSEEDENFIMEDTE